MSDSEPPPVSPLSTHQESGAAHALTDREPGARPAPAAGARRFAGKVALVTGASDRGIGGAIAERLADEGAAVVLATRGEPQRLRKRLDRLGHEHLYTHCDVRRGDQVQQAVDSGLAAFGRLDVVVNNAGIEYGLPLDEFTDDQWAELLDVNLHGAIRMIRSALPHLAQHGGAIVNVASALALGGCPSFSIYSAGKAGLVGLTQSLAWELAPRRIRVTCVAPALVKTPMTWKHVQHFTPQAWQHVEAHHPLGVGMPHDVAAAVAFLASDDARWITGITLPLGWTQHYPLPVDHFPRGTSADLDEALRPAAEPAALKPKPR